jgi:sec-independent protein translocase protein TatA
LSKNEGGLQKPPYFCYVSTGEIILILFVYLLFFGAKGIPSLAQTMGKAIYQFRNAAKDVQDEIMKGATDIKREMQLPLDQMGMEDTPRAKAPAHVVQQTCQSLAVCIVNASKSIGIARKMRCRIFCL